MPVTSVTTDPEALTMTLVADFPAPVERLWGAFTDPRKLERFWGPPGYPATFGTYDLRPGGVSHYWMTSPQGQRFHGRWDFVEVEEPHRIVVLDSFADADGEVDPSIPTGRMTFLFESTPDGSRFTAVSASPTAEALEQVLAMGQAEGMRQSIDQLDAVLQDLRAYAQGKGTRTELLDDQHVRITRLVEGPRDLVWRAHHEPALLKQWLLGPDGWQLIECEVGDTYRYVWQQGEDAATRFGFEGETVLSEPAWRAVTTERMLGTDGPTTLNDLQLYEEDGATLLTLLIEYPDKDTRDMILATGMTDGMETSYARLEQAVLAPA
ncbi:SRPBCC family protein [Microbacterium sp.]|uniref:SRPBCC family protein n=1 Tax=Microbacterium sp. TaxID=51671 RepID=UPI003C70F545